MTKEDAQHPGKWIKSEVIPDGMSVTQAAKLIGVSRPTLSNLLNGKASLSAEMAARLEKAFGHPRDQLLELQATFDAAKAKHKRLPTETGAYTPPFLGITVNDIQGWVDHNIFARSRFAVFLRTLVHSTGVGLEEVNFPGNDEAETPGWDGLVQANDGTPWIPVGKSGWEFGTTTNIKGKADGDFDKSVKHVKDEGERKSITFVFVTPLRWKQKEEWVKAQKAKGLWKDVRAYDANDLEQWLEQSLPGQVWFANETASPAKDVRTLDQCWNNWADAAKPSLPGELFAPAIHANKSTVLAQLSKPEDGPVVISADSTEEALAFLSQLFRTSEDDDLSKYRDRVLVFDKPGVLPKLAQGAKRFIPVVHTREVEKELAPLATSIPAIIVYPRNATRSEPDVVLEPTTYENFRQALESIGLDRDKIRTLSNESGHSLTVLRRRLAIVDAIRVPEWASNNEVANSLIPFLFVGAWQVANEADREAISLLANETPYDELEKRLQSLCSINDAPVWSIGNYRGVVSKIDLLYAIANQITTDDLRRYFQIAGIVLGEDDPALDLEEDKRWAAAIYGKTREFSAAFREGISETLVLLSVHGKALFAGRGIDTEEEIAAVIRELLPEPLTTRVLENHNKDLPTYAEAAPHEFLSLIERDLKQDEPATLGLLKPVSTSFFSGGPSRTGLLWALEGLAWDPKTMPRAAHILARLAEIEIDDNWGNKPMHSLKSIFSSWMPQTAAPYEERLAVLKAITEKHPKVGWELASSQFGSYHEVGDYSHKPKWRADGNGFGEPLRDKAVIHKFINEMVELCLSWKRHDIETLSDLIDRLHSLDESQQERVWSLVEDWSKTAANDAEKAELKERIRVKLLTRRAARRLKGRNLGPTLTKGAEKIVAALEPEDLLYKHLWLFRNVWVEESADELEGIDELDIEARDRRIQEKRIAAIREISDSYGASKLLDLAEAGKAPAQVGFFAARNVFSEEQLVNFLSLALDTLRNSTDDSQSSRQAILGALRGITNEDERDRVLHAVLNERPQDERVELLLLSPFRRATWKLVDALDGNAQDRYWSEVNPDYIRESESENSEGIERLLKHDRPRAAFACIRLYVESVEPQILYRVLRAAASRGNDKPGEYMFDSYNLNKAFQHIDKSPSLDLEQKAALEFRYIEVLGKVWDKGKDGHGIPNIERYVEKNPEFFIEAIMWTYKRSDNGTDPDSLQVDDEQRAAIAEQSYKMLQAVQRIPGHNEHGDLDSKALAKWLSTVRAAAREMGRLDSADRTLGNLLSNAPLGDDGVWPCEVVRSVMESTQSDALMDGAVTGVLNSRGVVWRGEGGDQERDLASKYSGWADALKVTHPYVASKLLSEVAATYEHEAERQDTAAHVRRRLT